MANSRDNPRAMIRSLVRSLVHNLTVTQADSAWPAALRLDPVILRAAELMPMETVEVINLSTGERFTTWVEAAGEGSGEVHIHCGVKNAVRTGDVVSVVCRGQLHDGQALTHRAKVVTLDTQNRVVAITEAKTEV